MIMIRNFGDMNTHYSVTQIDDGEGDPDHFRCWPGAGVRRGTTSGTAGGVRTWQGRARTICAARPRTLQYSEALVFFPTVPPVLLERIGQRVLESPGAQQHVSCKAPSRMVQFDESSRAIPR